MYIGVFDLFKVGIGPSSSHTTGPMRAAKSFADQLESDLILEDVTRVEVDLCGSLGATGRGHLSPEAVMLGLLGEAPETVIPDSVPSTIHEIRSTQVLLLGGRHRIAFREDDDLRMKPLTRLSFHTNGMVFRAFDEGDGLLSQRTYYSIGGGFVVEEGVEGLVDEASPEMVPHPFATAQELLQACDRTSRTIEELMLQNESMWRSRDEVTTRVLGIWATMEACIAKGCRTSGILPGGLRVARRAAELQRQLEAEASTADGLAQMDWVTLWALAVNEENAAGGRVVTAPTNGAAGIVPAVLKYYVTFIDGASEEGIITFLLVAAAVGSLFKQNASISGADVGCQGEVGAACSMAAAGLAAALGGSPGQVENAAEIGIEHHLGLTCDPVNGLVQIPCIERNAVAAAQAITAARMALHGTGTHRVSLDQAIKTMKDTGADMQDKYKETALGGLALNVVEC